MGLEPGFESRRYPHETLLTPGSAFGSREPENSRCSHGTHKALIVMRWSTLSQGLILTFCYYIDLARP